ncbi:hypothetical protein CPB85DRAFT_231712 [Mucidula mucida]|nr:hypothetical protein CPB85DRAFT_231712 [Mucidula mucida]
MASSERRPNQSEILNGLGTPPPNRRDASGDSSSVGKRKWSKKATKIFVPTNSPPSNGRVASGPFSGFRTQDTLHSEHHPQPDSEQNRLHSLNGNPAARTLTRTSLITATRDPAAPEAKPPIKKRKIAHSSDAVKHGPNPDLIEISDDEEDFGKKVARPSTSTHYNVSLAIRGAAQEAKDIDAKRKKVPPMKRPDSFPGPSSRSLKDFVDSGANNEIEEISSFSDSPISGKDLNKRHTGNVKEKIRRYEAYPMLDLNNLQPMVKRSGLKNKDSMKGKSPRVPPVGNAAQVNFNANNRAKPTKRAKRIVRLPLLDAYVGRRNCTHSTLAWNRDDGTMTVEDGKLPIPRLAREVSLKECNHLEFSTRDVGLPIFVVTWGNSDVDVIERQLCLKISARDRECATADFDAFFQWLKEGINQREVTMDPKALWERVKRQRDDTEVEEASAQAGPSSRRTVKKPDMSKFALLSDEEPDTPEIIVSLEKWKARTNGTSRVRQSNEGASTSAVAVPARRSQRQSAEHNRAVEQAIQKQPIEKADEIILVYPWGMPGAVNLNRGDIGRLDPGEFLNDNLIEFGLKLWLTKLEKEKPDLFKEVYVFSSFFYGKLKTKKGDEMEGYQQVRRWTSKVDIYSKKYLFVPINENYHWYLAVICNPQHVLLPPPELYSPSTRAKQRQATAGEQLPSEAAVSLMQDTPLEPETTAANPEQSSIALSSDAQEVLEVDGLVRMSQEMGLDSRPCTPPINTSTDVAMGSSPLTPTPADLLTDVDMDARSVTPDEDMHLAPEPAFSPIVSDTIGTAKRRQRPARVLDSDEEDFEPPKSVTGEASTSAAASGIPPAQFYGAGGKTRKRKSDALQESDVEVVEEVKNTSSRFKKDSKGKGKEVEKEGPKPIPPAPPYDRPTTTILTFDSLGSPHPKAVNILTAYLCMEAQDKLQMANTSKAVGKTASVPVQPNFCDCGLYLIHFVETFMSDPEHYINVSHAVCISILLAVLYS